MTSPLTAHGFAWCVQIRDTQFVARRSVGSFAGALHVSAPSPSSVDLPMLMRRFSQALLGIVYSGDWLAFIKEACVWALS